jgi:cation-transporting ATPase E
LAAAFPTQPQPVAAAVPFSSARRWSAVALKGPEGIEGWALGAPEAFGDLGPLHRAAQAAAAQGRRVLLLASIDPADLTGDGTPPTPPLAHPLGLVVLEDTLRPGVDQTLQFFADQQVGIKVISGDNPDTVGHVAAQAGIVARAEMTGDQFAAVPADEAGEVAERTDIFGRVAPEQKRGIVEALQSRGHHVAMTGDGVNDVLALRRADVGVALHGGTAAAQAVASLIMVTDAFSTLPEAVQEGRRIVSGVLVGARLFLAKSVYSLVITAAVIVVALLPGGDAQYPLHPRNLSSLSTLSIGFPAVVLAVINRRPARPGRLVAQVLAFAVPAGLVGGLAAVAAFYLDRHAVGATLPQARSVTTLALALVAVAFIPCGEALSGGSRRLGWAVGLAAAAACAFPVLFAVPALRAFYDLVTLPARQYALAAGVGFAGVASLVTLLATGWLNHDEQAPVADRPASSAVQTGLESGTTEV